jgi:hypothetical protein
MPERATAIIKDPDARAYLDSHAVNLARAAVQQHGERAVLFTRRSAAIHEAGHAVVFARTADEIVYHSPYRLTLKQRKTPWGPTWGGFTAVSPSAPELQINSLDHPEMMRIHGLRLLAGVLAEVMFDGSDFRTGSSVDEIAVAQQIANSIAGPERTPQNVMAEMMLETAAMLRADKESLLRIAARLERDRKIGPSDLRRMLPKWGDANKTQMRPVDACVEY